MEAKPSKFGGGVLVLSLFIVVVFLSHQGNCWPEAGTGETPSPHCPPLREMLRGREGLLHRGRVALSRAQCGLALDPHLYPLVSNLKPQPFVPESSRGNHSFWKQTFVKLLGEQC